MTTEAFLRCFRRFVAHHSRPSLVVSDNAKTFKSASKELEKITYDPSVVKYFAQEKIKIMVLQLRETPWWEGFYERLVKSLKRYLKKTIGWAKLSYDELVTVVTEGEMILNCQPISYVSSEDLEEPLTPSHLIVGRRLSTLPEIVLLMQILEFYRMTWTEEQNTLIWFWLIFGSVGEENTFLNYEMPITNWRRKRYQG